MRKAIVALILSLTAQLSANQENCTTRLSGLENALYSDGRNQLSMESAFFPFTEQPSRFLKVVYNFTDGDDVDCIVTFFWSVGSFLFIQPPSIFSYTSLLFNYPSNSVDNVTILLPNKCRPLVNNNNNKSRCSCDTHGITFLDMLTRHVSQISIFTQYTLVQLCRFLAAELC